ncbi:hypothetical protein [Streptomyces sp. B1I3]|uniref:hypothetical protein n=1 Tax=Streptomyces sp. B1I3 TaxID=3042264 RepID=UPI002781B55B|nr:hypothetical protein [Streptomyces sp. B1I3]MDQ0796619.1 hypothetical protein [Streptomyces sp. B1I3]
MRDDVTDDKKGLYRDLLIGLYGWHDSLVSVLKDEDDGKLSDNRSAACKWIVETSLVSSDAVRAAVRDVHRAPFRAQPVIHGGTSTTDEWPLQGVQEGLSALEDALGAELVAPARAASRPWLRHR